MAPHLREVHRRHGRRHERAAPQRQDQGADRGELRHFETPDFQRQSRDFAAAVKAAGKEVTLLEAPNYAHLEMGETLGNPYGPNGRAALALMRLARG